MAARLQQYVQGYAQRHIQSGSAAPLFHVAVGVCVGGYLTECTRHWWATAADRRAAAAAERELHTALGKSEEALEASKKQIREAEMAVANTRQAHTDAAQKLAQLIQQRSEREAAYKELKQKAEAPKVPVEEKKH
eukprot:evm.model.scf_131.6 EVM.evm.TU.scf_131.6   scf_131:46062-47800(+)